jgi:hypothetical protein
LCRLQFVRRGSEQKGNHHCAGNTTPGLLSTLVEQRKELKVRVIQAVLPTDELEQYKLMSPMAEDVWADRIESNALIWWAESGCHLFPRLALMAKDYFSAQGQSHSTELSHLSNIGILKRPQYHLNEPFRPPEMRRARIRIK